MVSFGLCSFLRIRQDLGKDLVEGVPHRLLLKEVLSSLQPNSFLLLVRPAAPLVASLLLVLVAMPFAPSSDGLQPSSLRPQFCKS